MAKRTVKQAPAPAPENARQLAEPRTVRSREGWARAAETAGHDWAKAFRANFERFPCTKYFFTLADCIGGSFPWAQSPEGYQFWREVYREVGGEMSANLVYQRMEHDALNKDDKGWWCKVVITKFKDNQRMEHDALSEMYDKSYGNE